jgi:hypothetical protein
LIERYLDRYGWARHEAQEEPGEREGVVLTGWRSSLGGDGYLLHVDPMVERNAFSLIVPGIVSAPRDATPESRLTGLLMGVGYVNYKIMIGKFAWDPADGEVRFQLAFPIGGSKLSYEQFEHCLRVTTTAVEEYAPKLKAIVEGDGSFDNLVRG